MGRHPKQRSITRRLFTSMTLVVLCSMGLLATVFLTLAGRYIYNENLNNLNTAVEKVGQVLSVAEDEIPDPAVRQKLAQHAAALVTEVTDAGLLVADADGKVIYASDGVSLTGDVLSEKVQEQIRSAASGDRRSRAKSITDLDGLLDKKYYVVGNCYKVEQGENFLIVLSDAGRFSGYLSDLIASFLWASLFMLLVSGGLALIMAHRVSAPLSQISKAAGQFGRGDFSARITVETGSNDEIAQLAQNFNTMAANLEAIDRSRQSFMGNIAHELRTPMTSIKGFVDGMLDGVIPPEMYPRYLGLVSDEVARLTRLIQSMLDITKLEAGEYKVNARSYDIWETIGAVLMNSEQRLVEGRIGIGGYDPQRALVYADSDLIYQVVYNIVDNAIKFTPAGGRIDLAVVTVKDRVHVHIRNTGEGVPAEQLPYLFERFYKGDKSRGLHAKGAGLGMHISKVLIGVSGGSIRVDSDSASWTEFSFDLPAGRPELPASKKERTGGRLMKFRKKQQ